MGIYVLQNWTMTTVKIALYEDGMVPYCNLVKFLLVMDWMNCLCYIIYTVFHNYRWTLLYVHLVQKGIYHGTCPFTALNNKNLWFIMKNSSHDALFDNKIFVMKVQISLLFSSYFWYFIVNMIIFQAIWIAGFIGFLHKWM